jgi:transmembrane sensor
VEQTLRTVVADLNRYSHRPVVVADPTLEDIRISGTAKVDQLDGWLDALSAMLDARLIRDENGVTLDSGDPDP